MPLFLALMAAALLQAAQTVRVASCNLHNYMLMDRRVDGVFFKNYPKPEAEKAALREVIKSANPDVLAVQEIGGRQFLYELQRDLKSAGVDYPNTVMLEAVDGGRHIAVLSKIPFAAVAKHNGLEFQYFGGREKVLRGLLEVSFTTGQTAWTLYTAHLKSRWTVRDDDPDAAQFRQAEAQTVRQKIMEKFPPASVGEFLIAGDINDSPNGGTLIQLAGEGAPPFMEAIPAVDSHGETWTYHMAKNDFYGRYDYVLASPALKKRVKGGAGSIADIPAALKASDHRLVYVDLVFQ